jgi:hypothetical protein
MGVLHNVYRILQKRRFKPSRRPYRMKKVIEPRMNADERG